MKFKNKIISLLVLLTVTVLLQACGSGGDGEGPDGGSAEDTAEALRVADERDDIVGVIDA